MAQGLGLHRDGSHYQNLSIYKQEMRRRLWWHTAILDLRASEDLGSDPSIYDMMSDTKLPRNLNDCDIYFDMKELPESRVGCTDMTFSLVRFEFSPLLRRMAFTPPNCPKGGKGHWHGFHHGPLAMPFDKRKEKLERLTQEINEKYLDKADTSKTLDFMISTTCRLMLAKMKLVCIPLIGACSVLIHI
jgi:hypothetical protein